MWGREGNSETSPQRQAQFNEISRRERMSPYKEREHRQLRSLKRGGAPLGLIANHHAGGRHQTSRRNYPGSCSQREPKRPKATP